MTTPIRRRARRGFSLPELLISMILISIIGVALTRLVLQQSRFNNKQLLQRSARGVARGAINIMESELRAVEQSAAFVSGGASVIPTPTVDQLVVNVPWAVGVWCTNQDLAILPVDSISESVGLANTVGVGVRNALDGRYVYNYVPSATASTNTAACTGAGITMTGTEAMPQMRMVRLNAPIVGTPGSPVMLYYRVRYLFGFSSSVPGRRGLFRSVANSSGTFATNTELVAPFADSSGFRYFVGTSRTPTNVIPTSGSNPLETITGVQVRLFAQSERNTQGQSIPESSNVRTSIFFRNRVD